MTKQYDKRANGWIERIHAEKYNNRSGRCTDASWWAVILVNENGEETDYYARQYENGFSTRAAACAKLNKAV